MEREGEACQVIARGIDVWFATEEGLEDNVVPRCIIVVERFEERKRERKFPLFCSCGECFKFS